MNNSLAEFQEFYEQADKEKEGASIEHLKTVLTPLAEELKDLSEKKDQMAFELKELNKEIMQKESEIRRIWGPFIVGAEKATINCGSITITSEPKLQISTDDKERAIEWLQEHGYDGVMKWDVHTQTMYKIARDHYERDDNSEAIPGLKYEQFQVVKVK